MIGDAYRSVEGYVAEADLGLGCGVPTEHAGIRPGDTVLDLGAGAGVDAFVARRLVGEEGKVYGVDMTPDMVAKARANAEKLGYRNVEFRLGEIERLPFERDMIDVVISNCVLNLVPEKARAFAEIHRVLRPGAHFCVSDIVASAPLPEGMRNAAALYVGCVAGAEPEADYSPSLRTQASATSGSSSPGASISPRRPGRHAGGERHRSCARGRPTCQERDGRRRQARELNE